MPDATVELDVRVIPPRDKHPSIFRTFDGLTGGQAMWTTAVVSTLAGATIALLIIRHSLRFKRPVLEGENFVLHHPKLDIVMVFIGTTAMVFAQASGTIR